MTPYKHDMNDEPKPKIKQLLPEGWRKFKIISGEERVSKGGNEMIVLEVEDVGTEYREDWYCVTVKGKRWFLKSILTACELAAGQDGVYDWDIHDLIDKEVAGLVGHEPNEYINRNGDTIKTTQHRIQEVKKVDDAISWDE